VIVVIASTYLTPDEYRTIELSSAERHEYRNGEIISMAGGTETHSLIASNLLIFLGFSLRDTNFRLYNSDLRIWIPRYNHGTYADLVAITNKPEFTANRTDEILNPLLIVEVLSPSTEVYDRGEKFRKYRSLPSFREYLLVSQTEAYVEQYYKPELETSDRWEWRVYDQIDQSVFLHSLNIEIPMTEIYRRIDITAIV